MPDKQELLRALPKVDEVLGLPALAGDIEQRGHAAVATAVRAVVDELRAGVLGGGRTALPGEAEMAGLVLSKIQRDAAPSLRRMVNATGVILHTNLGRAPLAEEAAQAVQDVALGYANLEYNVEAGSRGSRYSHVEALLCELTGAEAAMVVNNNAGAVLLMLAALAAGKQAIVSRGELVEIGGAFRVPDIMALSGARLCEVGTTNRTRTADYERAIEPEGSGVLFKAHTSNYKMVGFTEEAPLVELVALGKRYAMPVLYDIGSGSLLPLGPAGIPGEPSVPDCVASGADVVSFSGDKLLGGPQAGILLGKRDAIAQIRSHPYTRALRIDKLTLAALEATLRLYRDTERAKQRIPTLRMLFATQAEMREKAARLKAALALPESVAAVVDTDGQMGGGSLPGEVLHSAAVRIAPRAITVNTLEEALRRFAVPIVGRIAHEALLLDVRTVEEEDFGYLAQCLHAVEGL